MLKFLNIFRDNRKKVIAISLAIVIVIYSINLYNNYAKNKAMKDSFNNSSSSNNTTTAIVESSPNNQKSNEIENKSITVTSKNELINKFINLCNKNQTEEAYELLSDECKEFVFNNNIQEFSEKYAKTILSGTSNFRTIEIDNNAHYSVYKVNFSEDPIQTGYIENEDNKVDYITVVKNNNGYKLNVLGFIKKEDINIYKKQPYFNVNVLYKLVYANYEIYAINIKNTIKSDIILDDMSSGTNTYLVDSEGNKSNIANDEYTFDYAKIQYGKENNINLKFNKKYVSTNGEIKYMFFSNIIVINRSYYDTDTQVIDNETGSVNYKNETTSYMKKITLYIEF